MRERKAAIRGALAAVAVAALAACGHPEQNVVEQYFNAVNQGDDQTLASFATVKFDKKVQSWSITDPGVEQRVPAELPNLAKAVADTEAALADNKKTYNTYFLDHPKEVDQVRDLLRKDANIPSSLKKYAEDWKAFTEKERDLKRQLVDAKAAVDKEKRAVVLSVGQVDDVESLTGEMVTKSLGLSLTIDGTAKPYEMMLRKYAMQSPAGGGRQVSRWVVSGLDAK
jgi:outer membrane lipopolysaccharide assembly protein LptE/RlpB